MLWTEEQIETSVEHVAQQGLLYEGNPKAFVFLPGKNVDSQVLKLTRIRGSLRRRSTYHATLFDFNRRRVEEVIMPGSQPLLVLQ